MIDKKTELAMVSCALFKKKQFGMFNHKMLKDVCKKTGFSEAQIAKSMANFHNIHYGVGGLPHTSQLQHYVYNNHFKTL